MPLFGKKKDSRYDNQSSSSSSKQIDNRGSPNVTSNTNNKQAVRNNSIQGNGTAPTSPTSPSDNGSKRKSNGSNNSSTEAASATNTDEMAQTKPKLVFHCQQAHGSPTAVISGFTNVKELYTKIADAFEIPATEILFCTLNTHKIDMTRLLGGQIGLDDFIFAHIKGRPKEVEVSKDVEALGLTITDNGAGYSFIKRIKEGSIMDKIEGINVGDHIEKINGHSMQGYRHFEVAKALKEVQQGSSFLLRVVEPMQSGFSNIGGASRGGNKKASMGTGKETLRLRSKGSASIEVPDDIVDVAVDKINARLEAYLGINDSELAQTIWETGSKMKNPVEFTEELQKTELAMFGFSDEFIFEIWGDIGDAKSGRMVKVTQFEEKF